MKIQILKSFQKKERLCYLSWYECDAGDAPAE